MNTETRFTTGPWKCEKELGAPTGEWLISIDAGNRGRGIAIAQTRAGTGETLANARLIAAAPDMYTALKDAREYVAILLAEKRREYAGYEGITDVPDIEACIAQIDAALAKAEGEA